MKKEKIALFGIDFQNDFIDKSSPMCVNGAIDDVTRFGEFILNNVEKIDNIFLSMDTHHYYHIAHSCFWVDKDGNHPSAFSTITCKEIYDKWFPSHKDVSEEYIRSYFETLESKNKELTIWPLHCLEGTRGWALADELIEPIKEWSHRHQKYPTFIYKGRNMLTEHFSALEAIMLIELDSSTYFNYDLIYQLKDFDKILIGGEAATHCVKETIQSLLRAPEIVQNSILVSDWASPIGGNKPYNFSDDLTYNSFMESGGLIVSQDNITI